MKYIPLQKVVDVLSQKFHQELPSESETQEENSNQSGLFCRQWAESLSTMSQDLLQFFADKEEHFLALGSLIQEGYKESKDLSASSNHLVNQVNNEDQSQIIRGLNQKVHEIENYWQVFHPETIWNRLNLLHNVTLDLASLLSRFERIVLRLKVLSVSTRVETARLGQEGEGFGILAQDVSTLNLQADDETQKIKEKTQSVQEDIQVACQKTEVLSQEQDIDAQNLMQEIKQGLSQLDDLQGLSSQLIDKLSSHTELITDKIGEIVSKIQFHDITRQQIQHVSEVMNEVKNEVKDHDYSQENSEEDIEILSWITDVCKLQISHIDASKEGFSQALYHIRNSIGDIIEQIQNIVSDIQQMSGDQDGHSVLEKIQMDMTKVVQALRKTSGKSDEVVEIMKVVGGVVQEMGVFVENIEEVGVSIERIGLNASVQAAHIGDNGRAMGVLAESIHSLSIESKVQTREITNSLNKIISESEHFQSQAREANELASKESALISDFERLIKSLQQTHNNIQSHLSYIQETSRNLIDKLQKIVEDKELENEVLDRFEEAKKEIREIKDMMTQYLPEQGVKPSERLRSILEKYTMESERQVHMKLFEEEEDDMNQDNVSFFDNEVDDNVDLFDEDEDEQKEKDALGDNVELF